ncbi:hypothetical protein Adi01nite_14440 [Amorphoplanes digitatis]|nr:hypothetical protein Adi01nite_14440 [Actinoplanes digitatis]
MRGRVAGLTATDRGGTLRPGTGRVHQRPTDHAGHEHAGHAGAVAPVAGRHPAYEPHVHEADAVV